MSLNKTILVTGAGALVGMGILRAIHNSRLGNITIITGDPDHNAPGHTLGDKSYLLEMADSPTYINNLCSIIQENKVDLLIPGTDIELPVISQNLDLLPCAVVISSPEEIEIADSKLKTAAFLKDNGFEYAASARASDLDEVNELIKEFGFPLFAKPNRGRRSIGSKIVRSTKEIINLSEEYPLGLIIQEYLPEKDGEFTSGSLVIDGLCRGTITLKRILRDGNTYRAISTEDNYPEYTNTISKIAETLKPIGPANFQFRIRNGKPVVFEINARFSGTTPIRAFIGYNEVEHIINHYLFNKDIPSVPKLENSTIMRVWSDVVVNTKDLDSLKEHSFTHSICKASIGFP
jgi:carbamoyl-phosphate synthase large subunit